jgi:hypothetical protein
MAHARTTILAYGEERRDAQALQRHLQETREQIGSGLPALETRHTRAPAAIAAVHEIERQSYDLVVIAAPRSDFDLAEQILQAGDHHLLLASRVQTTPGRVLVCVAAGEPGKDDVLFSGRLLRHLGPEVTVLSVLPLVASPQDRARAERFIAAGVRTMAVLGVQAQAKLRVGAVRDEIMDEMTNGGYDMLVLGAPLPRDDRRSALAGVVGEILNTATERPVLIVRSHAFARKPWPELNRRMANLEEVIR